MHLNIFSTNLKNFWIKVCTMQEKASDIIFSFGYDKIVDIPGAIMPM